MATVMTREQAAAAVTAATAERDGIQTNLLELDGSFGKQMLAGAALALGLAFGLGGREMAGRALSSLFDKNNLKKPAAADNGYQQQTAYQTPAQQYPPEQYPSSEQYPASHGAPQNGGWSNGAPQ